MPLCPAWPSSRLHSHLRLWPSWLPSSPGHTESLSRGPVPKEPSVCLGGVEGDSASEHIHAHSQTLAFLQKKLPLMALSTTMAESFKELDPDSSMG